MATRRGVFILGCHASNFDLAGITLCQLLDVPVQVLSVSNPTPGFVLFNNLRRQVDAEVAPISPTSLRATLRCLQDGGVVLTGVDRPTGERDQPIEFFDATAHVSTGYIRIPLSTDCQLVTAATVYEKGAYHVHVNPLLEMVRTDDQQEDVRMNARCVLMEFELFIARHPEQWMTFVPVWDDHEVR